MAKYHLEFCPFCGSATSPRLKFHGMGIKRFFIVQCERNLGGCGANVTGGTRHFAIENWNRRVASSRNVKSECQGGNVQKSGMWLNGEGYEYEFAYCSECGRMQWAGWNSHADAREEVINFHENYHYCPECGAKMEGGEYVGK